MVWENNWFVVDIHVGVHVVGLVVEILMTVAMGMGIWEAVNWLDISLMVRVMWSFIVIVSGMWMHIVLLWVETCILHVVMFNTVMGLAFDIVEKLIISMLNIVNHCGSEMVLSIMAIGVSGVVGVVWSIVLEILGQVMVIVVVANIELVMMLSCTTVVQVRRSIVGIWVVDIMDPVIWMVLNSMNIMVIRCMSWAVFSLILIAVVGSVVAIDSSVNVVVLTVILSCEVSMVTQMWLMSLQVPVSLVEMSKRVAILSVEWSCMVWVLLGMVLIRGQIVMWDIPGTVQVISMMGVDWMVSCCSVVVIVIFRDKWIVGVVMSMGVVGIMEGDSIFEVFIILLLFLGWFVGLACFLVLHEILWVMISQIFVVVHWLIHVWVGISVSISVWTVSSMVPRVAIVATIWESAKSSIATVLWESAEVSISWMTAIWHLVFSVVMELLTLI